MTADHLDSLNPAQREAVLATQGPLLVLAGAGAGKTRVVAHRMLEIAKQGVAPEQILAITFTNKAAREMRERAEGLMEEHGFLKRAAAQRSAFSYGGPSGLREGPFVSTFHSLGLSIIKENYRALAFKRFPAIYDRADSLRAMKSALKEVGIDEELEARMVLGIVSREKGGGIGAAQFLERAEDPRARAIGTAWERYEAALRADQALDFDDLLARAVAFLERSEEARAAYRARWRYIHIDEYQDTNDIQSRLARLLVGPERNICAVGDIDQTIYTWRGANIRNIMLFEKEYAGARVVLLEENYRSTKTILAAANSVIAKNAYRVEKNLFTKNADGDRIVRYRAFNETDEAAFVAREAGEMLARGASPRDIAVLYRANFQSRALEEAFLQAGIDYQVLGTRFFERAEVKDTLAYIRAALFATSADIARAANTPRRGIGKTTLLAMLSGRESELRGGMREKVAGFRALLARIADESERLSAAELVRYVMRESGIERELREDKLEGVDRLDNLKELAALAARFEALPAPEGIHTFLEQAALQSEQDELKEDRDAVRLMTVHASKGLEFPHVFIVGLEEGLFPYAQGGESGRDAEEERRLMYVAVTRAKKKLYLTHASMRTVFGSQSFSEPSQFLRDMPDDLVEEAEPERLGRTIYLE